MPEDAGRRRPSPGKTTGMIAGDMGGMRAAMSNFLGPEGDRSGDGALDGVGSYLGGGGGAVGAVEMHLAAIGKDRLPAITATVLADEAEERLGAAIHF